MNPHPHGVSLDALRGATPLPAVNRNERRAFLRAGSLGVSSLVLSRLFRLQAASDSPGRKLRSIIMVMMSGGPSHIDTYDMKPEAPAEFRSPFTAISTTHPGVSFCEYLPLHARITDQFTLIRSLKMGFNDHQNQCEILCGFPAQVVGGQPASPRRPVFGSVISRFGRSAVPLVPQYVSLTPEDPDRLKQQDPAYVGVGHRPFVPTQDGLANLGLAEGLDLGRLTERKQLLHSFDTLRRDIDLKQDMEGMDAFNAKALELMRSDNVRNAFDLSREPDHVRQLYGTPALDKLAQKTTGGYRWEHERFLLARRLVEAGVPVVTIFLGGWDHHGKISGEKLGIFEKLDGILPAFDRYLHGLITDLRQRGLDQEVAVLAWGEFGRAPRIDQKNVGRDHWPAANLALVAGGGMRMGQVIGATDGRAESVVDRPCAAQNVLATIYHLMGIDPTLTLPDHQGRPTALLDDPRPVSELL